MCVCVCNMGSSEGGGRKGRLICRLIPSNFHSDGSNENKAVVETIRVRSEIVSPVINDFIHACVHGVDWE